MAAFDATINRLKAELGGYDFVVTDSANPDDVLQSKMFLQRRTFHETQLRNLDRQRSSQSQDQS